MSNKRTAPDMSGNRYCGPMVLATIMGLSTAEAAEKVRLANSHVGRAVKGMHNSDLLRTLNRNGYRTEEQTGLRLRYVPDRRPGKPTVQVDKTVERCDHGRRDIKSYVRFDDAMARKPHMITYLTNVSGPTDWSAPYTPVKRVGPTLAEWMRSKRDPDAFYIVNVTNHYVLVRGRKFIDNHSKEWVFLRSAPHRRKRVAHVFKVTMV